MKITGAGIDLVTPADTAAPDEVVCVAIVVVVAFFVEVSGTVILTASDNLPNRVFFFDFFGDLWDFLFNQPPLAFVFP